VGGYDLTSHLTHTIGHLDFLTKGQICFHKTRLVTNMLNSSLGYHRQVVIGRGSGLEKSEVEVVPDNEVCI